MKMQNIPLHLFIFIKLTISYNIPTPEILMKNCLHVTIHGQYHTIFVEDSTDTNILLKDCIIKKIHMNQSILLLRGLKSHKQVDPIMSNQPNLIIMTKSLNNRLFDIFNSSLNSAITFHWNLLYIVVAENEGIYECNDGKFYENTFNEILKFMNDLWHRFEMIRVVLLFPFSCPRTYVIYGENMQANTSLLNRTIRLIRPKTFNELSSAILNSSSGLTYGYPVKISIFPRFPTSLTKCEEIQTYVNSDDNINKGFCGLDGLIMKDVIKYFKFNMILSKERRCIGHGSVNSLQEVSGSLGCVINKTVNISFNSRFMIMYPNNNFQYLQPVGHDSLCALLPVPRIYSLWHYPHMPLDSIFWFLITLIIVIMAAAAWISGRISNKLTGEKPLTFQACILHFATSTLYGFSLKKCNRFYILRGLCLGFSIILLSYYQGYINYTFTTLKRYERIKTLQQLFDLKYVLYTSPPILDLLTPLKNPNNPQEVDFIKRVKLQPRTDIGAVLERPKTVTLGRFTDASSEILLRYPDRYGKPMIYVVDECFRVYYLSYICRFDFPFTKKFKIFLERLAQTGIPDKYYKWTRQTLRLPDSMPKDEPEPRPIAKIQMQDQIIAFGVLLSGYVVSTIAFILEIWLARRNNISTVKQT